MTHDESWHSAMYLSRRCLVKGVQPELARHSLTTRAKTAIQRAAGRSRCGCRRATAGATTMPRIKIQVTEPNQPHACKYSMAAGGKRRERTSAYCSQCTRSSPFAPGQYRIWDQRRHAANPVMAAGFRMGASGSWPIGDICSGTGLRWWVTLRLPTLRLTNRGKVVGARAGRVGLSAAGYQSARDRPANERVQRASRPFAGSRGSAPRLSAATSVFCQGGASPPQESRPA